MKRCIVESVAWDEAKSTGTNVSRVGGSRKYFECACVSLHSAAQTNPDIDRVLVTNTEVPQDCKDVLVRDGVRILNQPFDKFVFSRDVEWHLAYYKLCALQAVIDECAYDELLMLDTDTWVRKPLDDMFAEISGGGLVSMTSTRESITR